MAACPGKLVPCIANRVLMSSENAHRFPLLCFPLHGAETFRQCPKYTPITDGRRCIAQAPRLFDQYFVAGEQLIDQIGHWLMIFLQYGSKTRPSWRHL